FRLKNHQTMVFLSDIVSISVEQHTKDGVTDQYIKKIKSMVKKIVNLDQYDSQLFIKLQNDLERFIKRQIKRTEIKKKREDEKQKGLKKIIQAKKSAKQLLHDRIANKRLPKFVNNILIDEWFNVLVLFNLRHDPQPDEYQDSLIFIDLLVELTHADSQSIYSKSQILTLLKKYKKGLELVAHTTTDSKAKSKKLLNNINQLINSRISKKKKIEGKIKKEKIRKEELKSNVAKKNKEQKPKKDIAKAKNIIISSALKNPKKYKNTKQKRGIKTTAPQSESKMTYSELIDSFKEGDWYEISTDNHKFIKAKLSWISPISGKYLFVDLNGLKITDKSESELKLSLQNKTIRILNSN
ncbi:MAG: DUF1631 domain-containing protein, partial [Proteobacteria bacterium]|nr:DUF1631 domain-containing protein [Pseudomonadota bacterium]